jgi:hypothetical protein
VDQGLEVGTHYQLSLFDPSVMAQKPVSLEILARERIAVDGEMREAYKVRTSYSGLEILSWLDSKGERLKEEGFMGLRMVKMSEDEARSGIRSDPEVDITEAVSIPSNEILENPSALALLKVQLRGINLDDLDLNTGRQRLRGSVLEIRLESDASTSVAEGVNGGAYLRSSPFVQSDHPEIKALAEQIVRQVMDDEEKVRRILNWVHASIEKRGTVSVPNALDTLKTKAGDCNEHAVLFAALGRAVGIPTKISVGLVYTRGRFYYHAWNEVFLGQWTAVDALMGQIPADVTHIKFVDGDLDKQAMMLQVIGKVELTVLEAV